MKQGPAVFRNLSNMVFKDKIVLSELETFWCLWINCCSNKKKHKYTQKYGAGKSYRGHLVI